MLTPRFDGALHHAARLHRSQTRKGTTTPYISHLMAVSALVLDHGGDEDQAIAALLHDTIEDAGETNASLQQVYGPRVAQIVSECSDFDGSEPRPDWTTRKRGYIDALAGKSDDAILVTSCDKLHNAESILEDLHATGPAVFDRFTAGRDGTLWYYDTLATALAQRAAAPLGTRLRRIVSALLDAAETA